ncbi:MAG TPA: hypothetical protein VKR30_00495 [Candidatus Limnocylindrales bacterium]|nr:hypothetical protein [Candidatus Limnocylindrales bacterium]
MTAIVLPDIDLDELRRNVPSLAEIDLPSLGKAGAVADDAIDRWRGRSRGPSWPWIVAAIFAVGLIGTLVALVTWSRRGATIEELEIEPGLMGGEAATGYSTETDSESTPA